MLTRCPACDTQFRIRARHLIAARGRVRCGACGEAFDAIEHLFDDDALISMSATPDTAPKKPASASAPLSGFDSSLDELEMPQGLRGREITQENEPQDMPFSDPFADPFAIDDSLPVDDETEEEPHQRRTWLWAVAIGLLLLLAATQVVWFQRDWVANQFPATRPLLEGLCDRLDCEVYRRATPAAYELLSRDVRAHPVYKDVLLVNATFINRANERQPYPDIELALYDTSGQMQGYRKFVAADYLDQSLPVVAGVAPGTPLHVVLEVSGPTDDAVSFEFGLL